MIEDVKISGAVTNANLFKFDGLAKRMRIAGVEALIMGCTELSSLLNRIKKNDLKAVDSNIALACAALKLLQMPKHLIDSDEKF